MSHNYSYRRPPPAKDLRASAFDSPDHLHPGDHGHNVYRSSQEPPSHSTIPSYPSSSSRASAANESPYSFSLNQSDPYSSLSRSDPYSSSLSRSDQTLTLLSSCGLEPKDLSLLAEMPEELITVENLPRLLLEIRKKRATQQPPYPAMISYPPAATSRPPTATPPPGRAWEQGDQSRSQPLDYPLDPHHALPPSQLLPTEQAEPWQLDRHGNPMQYTRSRLEPVPVRVVDYHYGKETPRSYQTPRSTYSTAQGGSSNSWKPPNSSQPAVDYRYPPPPATNYRPRPDQDVPVVTIKMATSGNTPTKKAALDFHGAVPQTFPYSCCLCDITVLSEKFWFTHVNGTQHADGQLTLLQMYPEWDCRMQTARSGDDHTDRPRVEEKTGGPSHRSINYLGKPSSSGSRKNVDTKTKVTKGSGKVVCVKFTARCLNEDGLKDLIKPFGEVVKVIMFHALAFVELESTDQAADIVTYYLSNPVMVKGGQVTFSVSSTFNFLQSSRVLSFSPVPPGKESAAWKRELLAVAEGFGPVAHSLFLPTQAFVEMTNALDAQKLVGHHTSKHLKIDEIHIKVAFSSEYDTFRTMSERKSSDRKSPDRSRKSEDRSKRKRTPSPRRRSLSPRRDSPTSSKRRRSRERDSDRHKERVKSNSGGKSRPKSPRKQSSSRSSRSPRRPRSPSKQSSSRSSRSPRRPRSPSKQSSSRSSRSPRRPRSPSKQSSSRSSRSPRRPRSPSKQSSSRSSRSPRRPRSPSKQSSSRSSRSPRRPRSPSKQSSSRSSRSPRRPRSPSKQSSSRSSRSPHSHTKERVSSEKVSPISTTTRSQPPIKNKTTSQSSTVMEKSKKAVDTIDQSKQETETQDSHEDGAMEACEMDSDIEGMAVYGEDGEENSDMGEVGEGEVEEEEEPQESAEDMIQEFKELCEPRQKATSGTVDDAPTEELSATGSEQGKELSVTGSEQGKELSVTGSEQGKELSATGSEQGKELSATGSERGKELSATGSERGKELSATGSEQGKELSATGSEQGKELSATGSEQGKELSATGSEQGKELSATGSEQGKELSATGSEQGKELSATGSEQGKELSATGSEQGKELSATGSEQGKELSATGSEQGKELSATGSEQGKEIDVEDQKGDTSYIDDEPDFPEDLENLITLDELEEDSSGDNQDNQSTDEIKSRSKSKPSGRDQTPGRVIYVKNLPRSFYTDSDFLKIVKGFGRVHRYLLLRNGEEGFIEMERSSDATKALRELRYNGCKLYGQKLIILRSQKYKRLTTGWKPDSDSKSDRKKDHLSTRSSSRIRSGRTSSHSKSVAKDDKTTEKDGKTTEKDDKTTEKDDKTTEKDDKTTEKDDKTTEKDDKTTEKDDKTTEKDGKTTEKDGKTTEKDDKTKEKDDKTKERDDKTTEKDDKTTEKDDKTTEKDEETMEKNEETMEKNEETMEKDEETMEKDEETKEKTSRQVRSKPAQHCDKEDIGASEGNIDKSSNSEDQKDAPVPAAEKEKQACSNEDNAETKMEDNVETGPDSMKTGMESSFQANNPVGREFIKPVMGYFCDLCQVIYVNEDEAKNQHCSSLCHYLKVMEHSGKDTASS
ncbi:nipped-B-like protein B isoform X2 [Salvelinus fontinalis]|uniref:nipped-B-like protein B isoform X2 n=1 Tax=Salvelinus fontinalis TaxID=8038 RepID=UPI002486163E|nr:nipped-B-like protein B isoform X2 [Salvelinus fontinalis]